MKIWNSGENPKSLVENWTFLTRPGHVQLEKGVLSSIWPPGAALYECRWGFPPACQLLSLGAAGRRRHWWPPGGQDSGRLEPAAPAALAGHPGRRARLLLQLASLQPASIPGGMSGDSAQGEWGDRTLTSLLLSSSIFGSVEGGRYSTWCDMYAYR